MNEQDMLLFNMAMAWIAAEYTNYIRTKFTLEDDCSRDHDWWQQQFDNYSHRAKVLGTDTAAGRQAVAKMAATAIGWLMATLAKEGKVPEPGVASGYNLNRPEWKVEL
jgi:hypothetical protein